MSPSRLERPGFPIPADQTLNVLIDGSPSVHVVLSASDLLGRRVAHRVARDAHQRERLRMDVSGIPVGIYALIVRSGDRVLTRRTFVISC